MNGFQQRKENRNDNEKSTTKEFYYGGRALHHDRIWDAWTSGMPENWNLKKPGTLYFHHYYYPQESTITRQKTACYKSKQTADWLKI